MEADKDPVTIEPGAEEQPSADAPIAIARKAARPAKPAPKPKPKPVREPAAELPYAQVVLAPEAGHLGDTVDYLVPTDLDAAAQPGVRVRVRFAEQLVDGVLVGRSAESTFHEHFEWLQKVVSPIRVLSPEMIELARMVADKYAGTLADVVRLAVPARYASAEKQAEAGSDTRPMRPVDGAPWGPYGGGREFVSALRTKSGDRLPRALWTCLPGTDWATAIATALHAVATDAVVIPEPEFEPSPARAVPGSGAGSGYGSGSGSGSGSGYNSGSESGREPGFDPDSELGGDPPIDPDADDYFAPDDFDPAMYLDPAADITPEIAAAVRAETAPAVSAAAARTPEPEPIHHPGQGALAIVPDLRDLARLDRALTEIAGPGHHVVLSEELTPAKRYQNWLAVVRGDVRLVIGTRAALFAPVADLGFVALWDDGDDRHAEPGPPYPHVREVLLMRAHQTGAGALIGGHTCTSEGAQLVASRWAFPLTAFRSTVRTKAPLIRTPVDDPEEARDAGAVAARLPNLAWRTAGAGLANGPVLVQTPGGEYEPVLACLRCRKQARCGFCHGPLILSSTPATPASPLCGWCGRPAAGGWRCDGSLNDRPCGGDRFRMTAAGVERTAEELGRAFAGVKVVSSTREAAVAEVGPKSALVVAAPGAEPVAEGGYVAALLLDGWALLSRPDLRAAEDALRHWLNAAALVRPADEGGTVVVVADPGLAPVHALLQWDPVWHARRELEDRARRHHPPAARLAELTGSREAVAEELKLLRLPGGVEVLGPVPVAGHPGEEHRALIRVPRHLGAELAAAVREAHDTRTARRNADPVRVRIHPIRIG